VVEKIRELVNEDRRRTIHELAHTIEVSYGVCPEILTENLNMRRIAPSSGQRSRPHVPENHRLVTDNMVIILHPPYSPDFAPCDFAFFRKLKMKLKGRRFGTVSDIQRESQAVLDSVMENGFHVAFEAWRTDGTAVYVPKETILKEMAAKIE
jgi:hypothetical protein